MSEFPVSAEDLRRLARLVEAHALAELSYEDGELSVTLRAEPLPAATAAAPTAPVAVAGAPPVATGPKIEAPIMGIFYRSPAPGAPPFVEIGDVVAIGQPIGMIEAMKTFSEVLSEVGGRVAAIPAENGKLVQPGEVLLILEPA